MAKKLLSVLLAAVMLCAIMPLSAVQTFAAEADAEAVANGGEYPELRIDELASAEINTGGDSVIFKFVTEQFGEYSFYSMGSFNTQAYLYDSEFNEISYNDDGDDGNFKITETLNPGYTFYLKVKFLSDEATGQFDVFVTLNEASYDDDEYTQLVIGEDMHVVLDEDCNYTKTFIVKPGETNVYKFYTTAEYNLKGDLYCDGDWIASTDSNCTEYYLSARMIEGKEYYLEIFSYDDAEDGGAVEFDLYSEVVEYEQIYTDTDVTAQIGTPGESAMFMFVPEEDNCYAFYSTGSEDTYAELYDSELNRIAYNDDGGENYNFRITQELNAGETYYLKARFYSANETGRFNIFVETTLILTGMELLSPPDDTTTYEGFEGNFDYTGLSLRTTWSDGETVDWEYGNGNIIRGEKVHFGYNVTNKQIIVFLADKEVTIPVTVVENPVDYIEITEGGYAEVNENSEGYWGTQNNTGEDIFIYETGEIFRGTEAVIHFKDGTEEPVMLDNPLNGYWFSIKDNQYNEPYTLGENEVVVTYMGVEATITLNIIENPVASLELLTPSNCVLYEFADGYYTEYYDGDTGEYVEFFYYYLNQSHVNNAVVKINFKDGTSETAHPGDVVRDEPVDYYSDQYSEPWKVGENTYAISYMGVEVEDTITVEKSPVLSVELLEPEEITFIKETDGYWDEKYNPETENYDLKYFNYHYYNAFDSKQILITFRDGSTAIAYAYDTVRGYEVYISSSQSDNPWTVGGDNYVTLSYMGVEKKIPVTIAESPVKSFELVKATSAKLIENGDGFWSEDYNPETGNYDLKYFYYSFQASILSDAEFRITFNDGTSQIAHIGDEIGGYTVNYYDEQEDWKLGNDNLVTVGYMDKRTTMPIEIVESPAQSVVIDSAPSRTYIFGDRYFGGNNYFSANDYTGLKFTVKFKDGTQKTYTDADIKGRYVDGHWFGTENDRVQQLGENKVTLSYMGVSAEYNVNVIESPVDKLEIVEFPANAYDREYYNVDWTGAKIKVTYKNGTTSEITLNKDNIIFEKTMYFGTFTGFVLDGIKGELRVINIADDGLSAAVYFADKSASKAGIKTLESKQIADVQVEDFTASAENMLVNITYEDGETESFRIKDAAIGGNVVSAYMTTMLAYTPRGVLTFHVYDPDSSYGKDNLMYILGKYIKKNNEHEQDYLLGDVDGDGVVTVSDATLLQRYIAQFDVGSKKQIVMCGDVNGDGIISVSDVTWIQKHAAGIAAPYKIGQKVVS